MYRAPLPTLVLLALAASPVLSGGPGTYAHYTWPAVGKSDAAVSAMEVTHVWAKLPTAADKHGNAVFSR